MIQAGTLRSVIEIQSRDQAQDAMGQPINLWTTWAKQHAQIVGVNGAENFRGKQYAPEATHQVKTRWIKGLTPLNRILTNDGLILDIIAVDYPERMIELITIQCKERISQDGDLDVG